MKIKFSASPLRFTAQNLFLIVLSTGFNEKTCTKRAKRVNVTSEVTALSSKSDNGLNSRYITNDSAYDECGVGNEEAWKDNRC